MLSASIALDFGVHVWDIRRPFIPMLSYGKHTDVATGIVFRNEMDSILTTSRVRR